MPNLRIIFLIFRGTVLGRQVLQLRICTCPKRDMDQDEKNSEKQVSKNVLSNSRRLDPVSTDKRQASLELESPTQSSRTNFYFHGVN